MAQRTLRAIKDTVRYQKAGDTKQSDGGGEQHLLAGNISGGDYTSLVQFDMDWTGVAQIESAYLHVITKRDTPHEPYQPYDESGILISALAAAFSDPNNAEAENVFSSVAYAPVAKNNTSATQGVTQREADWDNRIAIHSLMNMVAPKTVRATNGQPGSGLTHYGFMIERRTTTDFPNPRMLVGSSKHPDTTSRPYIELNYSVVAAENTVGLITPTGNIAGIADQSFSGVFTPGSGQPADVKPSRWNIELRKAGASTNVWTYDAAATASDVASSSFNIPLSLVQTTGSQYKFVSGTDYEFRVRALDNKGVWTDFTHYRAFTLVTNAPILSNLRPAYDPPLDTLNNVFFQADYSDPDGNPVREFQVQVRSQTSPSNPDWEADLAWDSGPTSGQGSSPPDQTEGSQPDVVAPTTGGWQIQDNDLPDASVSADKVWGNEYFINDAGFINKVRYYHNYASQPSGRYIRVYSAFGALLGTASPTPAGVQAAGWMEGVFTPPLGVAPGNTLVIAYDGHVDGSSAMAEHAPLMRDGAPLIWRTGRTGYPAGGFPDQIEGQNTHYFADVEFFPVAPPTPPTPPPGQPPAGSVPLRVPYGGKGLAAGVYSWRMQAWDSLGASSGWVYSEFVLTTGFDVDPGDTDLLTGYAQRKLKARVLIKGMRNLLQTIDIVGTPTGGGFKLTFGSYTTPSVIPYDSTPATVQARLEALSNINPGDVTVTGTPGHYRVVFTGQWSGKNVPKMTAGGYTFTPTSVYVQVFGDGVPGYNVAVIEDAANIGASEMYNSGGEFFFSLPAIHPQVAVIEPYQVHYQLEHFRGESWKPVAGGLITDFDATDNDVVFYGQDYIAVLGRLVDDRFNPTASADAEAVLYPASGTGAKYVNRKISEIIKDQLDRAVHEPGSPVRFFTVGAIATMEERIDIFVSFKERLPFIAGLIESHRAGTGVRTRLMAVRASNGGWSWQVKEDSGKDRPNLRMEYGGLVQGFRVVPFGDFGTRLNAIGRVYNQLKIEYITTAGTPPPGQDSGYYEENYGRFSSARLYQDVTDVNDLKRRAQQAANQMTRVGKALALHLRPGSLAIKDGWDLTDSVLVDINRGVVSTKRMGSGYWTIWGWTWQLSPDGKEDITLSLLPKEDGSAPNLDLIPAAPIDSDKGDWQIEARDPDSVLDVSVFTHVNSNTGHIFQRDTSNGGWVDRTTNLPYNPTILIEGIVEPPHFAADYAPVFVGDELPSLPDSYYPPGTLASIPGTSVIWTVTSDGGDWVGVTAEPTGPVYLPDTTAPDAPVIKTLTTASVQQADGTSITSITATVGYTTPPAGLDDLDQFVLEATRATLSGGLPDWTLAITSVGAADQFGVVNTLITVPGLLAATSYSLRAYAVDQSGNRSNASAVSTITTAADTQGPPLPSGIVTQAGHATIGLRWDPSTALDFDYTEVQWRIASPPGNWISTQVSGTLTVITGLVNETGYQVRLRSVDTSGNVLRDAGGGVYETVKVAGDPNAGWVSAGTLTPTALAGDSLVWDQAMIEDVFAGNINADWINAGTLHVGVGAGTADAIEVYDSVGRLIGRWSTDGIEVMDPANPGYRLVITESTLTVWSNWDTAEPYKAVSLTPLGIDAASITFGSARGGHNLVQNSSFELGRLGAVTSTAHVWDVAADWNATRIGSDVNITTGADELFMTTV